MGGPARPCRQWDDERDAFPAETHDPAFKIRPQADTRARVDTHDQLEMRTQAETWGEALPKAGNQHSVGRKSDQKPY